MSGLPAGRLRAQVLFEVFRDDIELDSDGAHVADWYPAFPVSNVMPAEISPLSARELLTAASIASKATHRVRVRFREGFTAQMRGTVQKTRGTPLVFNVEGVIPDAETGGRWITLLASSGVSDGR